MGRAVNWFNKENFKRLGGGAPCGRGSKWVNFGQTVVVIGSYATLAPAGGYTGCIVCLVVLSFWVFVFVIVFRQVVL